MLLVIATRFSGQAELVVILFQPVFCDYAITAGVATRVHFMLAQLGQRAL